MSLVSTVAEPHGDGGLGHARRGGDDFEDRSLFPGDSESKSYARVSTTTPQSAANAQHTRRGMSATALVLSPSNQEQPGPPGPPTKRPHLSRPARHDPTQLDSTSSSRSGSDTPLTPRTPTAPSTRHRSTPTVPSPSLQLLLKQSPVAALAAQTSLDSPQTPRSGSRRMQLLKCSAQALTSETRSRPTLDGRAPHRQRHTPQRRGSLAMDGPLKASRKPRQLFGAFVRSPEAKPWPLSSTRTHSSRREVELRDKKGNAIRTPSKHVEARGAFFASPQQPFQGETGEATTGDQPPAEEVGADTNDRVQRLLSSHRCKSEGKTGSQPSTEQNLSRRARLLRLSQAQSVSAKSSRLVPKTAHVVGETTSATAARSVSDPVPTKPTTSHAPHSALFASLDQMLMDLNRERDERRARLATIANQTQAQAPASALQRSPSTRPRSLVSRPQTILASCDVSLSADPSTSAQANNIRIAAPEWPWEDLFV